MRPPHAGHAGIVCIRRTISPYTARDAAVDPEFQAARALRARAPAGRAAARPAARGRGPRFAPAEHRGSELRHRPDAVRRRVGTAWTAGAPMTSAVDEQL